MHARLYRLRIPNPSLCIGYAMQTEAWQHEIHFSLKKCYYIGLIEVYFKKKWQDLLSTDLSVAAPFLKQNYSYGIEFLFKSLQYC